MSFKDQEWGKRYEKMGDEAEGNFEAWARRRRLGFIRFGLDRPPLALHEIPTRIRHTPDYLMSKQFVECQGFGQDQVVKLKLEKYGALRWWNDTHPLYLYLWDRTHERETFVTLDSIDEVIAQQLEVRAFAEGKPYFALNANALFSRGVEL